MAIRSLSFASFQPGAGVADAVNQVDSTHMTVSGLTATERVILQELFLGGLAPSASSPMVMVLARTIIAGATLSLGAGSKDAATDASGATGVANGYTVSTTKPQRHATFGLLNCAMNAFGGNFKWFPSNIPGKDISAVGIAQPLGEMNLSAFTGSTAGAAVGGHMIYEKI